MSQKNIKFIIWWAAVFFVFVVGWLYANVYSELPDISQVKNMIFSQATVITDRNDEVLYKVFAENREYVPLSGVSQHMVNAMVAIEDKRYWEHAWLDPMGLIRAGITALLNPGSRIQGASTIPQQLVRNLLLTRDRKIDRKIKEIVLTSRLDGVLEDQISKEYPLLSADELHTKMKETILELYLNYIFFGNNSYGIEAASKTYFGTSSQNLTVMQSAVLASIPKGPSLYEPYKGKKLLMGEFVVTDSRDNVVVPTTGLQELIITQASQAILDANVKGKNEGNEFIKFVQWLLDFSVDYQWQQYDVQYTNGRKDLVLTRMFEDKYISDQQLKSAFIEGFNYQFKTHKFEILAPHFVHWIIELLEQNYDKETLQKGWFTVKTTLDLEAQREAERLLSNIQSDRQLYGASNKSMVYLDSTNGDVLSYVGSVDYFNEEIEWQNDMVRKPRQVGSTMKPFTYSYGFMNLPITEDTPIFDIPSNFGWDTPNNADDKFMGLLPLRNALAFSRNIPAIKMFLAAGWEAAIKPFLQKLWMTSIKDTTEYGYPLTLWAGEISMLELATAYSHLSAQGEPAEIDPILEVRARDWSLLYEKEVKKQERVIPAWVAYLLRDILSTPGNMPSAWVGMFSVRGIKLAIKSGTSNMQTDKWSRPRDGVLVAYTPSKVAIFWAGNTDATPLNKNAFGWTINGTEMKSFFGWLRDNNQITNENMTAVDVAEVQVSKISWKLAGDGTPSEFVVSSKAYGETRPSSVDGWATRIQYDTLCNGALSPYTPLTERWEWFVIDPVSFMPSSMDLADIRLWFSRGSKAGTGWINELSADQKWQVSRTTFNYPNIFTISPVDACPERIATADTNIKLSIVSPKSAGTIARKSAVTYRIEWPRKIKEVIVHANDVEVGRIRYAKARDNATDLIPVNVPTSVAEWTITLKIIAVDTDSFSNEVTASIKLIGTDTVAPKFENAKVITADDGTKTARLFFSDDVSYIAWGKVMQGTTKLADVKSSLVSFPITTVGNVDVTVTDAYNNTLTQTINLTNY
jgi:penicillin-binding protein 1A